MDSKTPKYRIEFDNITDVPVVYVDGEKYVSTEKIPALVSLHLNWETDGDALGQKMFSMTTLRKLGVSETIEQKDKRPKE